MSDPGLPQAHDAAALAEARLILAKARFAALAFTDAATGTPAISRIAFGLDLSGMPVSLISSLSGHSAALVANGACALLVGEPGARGDPLTHPRLMLQANATILDDQAQGRAALRDHWLITHPKSKLYVDFADFTFVRFAVASVFLNGGFGKAHHLQPGDLFI